jgi:hypothetical protein
VPSATIFKPGPIMGDEDDFLNNLLFQVSTTKRAIQGRTGRCPAVAYSTKFMHQLSCCFKCGVGSSGWCGTHDCAVQGSTSQGTAVLSKCNPAAQQKGASVKFHEDLLQQAISWRPLFVPSFAVLPTVCCAVLCCCAVSAGQVQHLCVDD